MNWRLTTLAPDLRMTWRRKGADRLDGSIRTLIKDDKEDHFSLVSLSGGCRGTIMFLRLKLIEGAG